MPERGTKPTISDFPRKFKKSTCVPANFGVTVYVWLHYTVLQFSVLANHYYGRYTRCDLSHKIGHISSYKIVWILGTHKGHQYYIGLLPFYFFNFLLTNNSKENNIYFVLTCLLLTPDTAEVCLASPANFIYGRVLAKVLSHVTIMPVL